MPPAARLALALAASAATAAARPAYSGSPIAVNTTTYQTEISPDVFYSADWDVVRQAAGDTLSSVQLLESR